VANDDFSGIHFRPPLDHIASWEGSHVEIDETTFEKVTATHESTKLSS
jgi:hypothetical protein